MCNCDNKSTGNSAFTGKCPYILYINCQFVLLQIFRKFNNLTVFYGIYGIFPLTFGILSFLNLLVSTIQKVSVTELRQKITVSSSFNLEKKCHEVCNAMASYISSFLLPIVSTIFENMYYCIT